MSMLTAAAACDIHREKLTHLYERSFRTENNEEQQTQTPHYTPTYITHSSSFADLCELNIIYFYVCLLFLYMFILNKRVLFYGELINRENHKYETDVSYLSLAYQ